MRYIVDWHIHSKYSRACSSQLELPNIAAWCERKGIDIVATGDWTHPAWFAHIKEHLVEDTQGVFRLKDGSSKTRFMLVQEVSQIYKKGGATRRIHNLVFSPSLETCEKVISDFESRGFNLKADGRPIFGMDSEDLYKRLKEIDEKVIVIPAHAWTPWYAIFGSKSGFDSIEECYGAEMAKHIYAIETGLSSNPPMNWQLSELDDIVLISNSDAHSPRNLGREANVFDLETPTYDEFVRILREKDAEKFRYTIEFYPEEGKYHLDGCAGCKFRCEPKESVRLGGKCPSCKKSLTLGVHHRVEALSNRDASAVQARKIPFKSIVPLAEIIAECFGVKSSQSARVEREYMKLTNEIADEFSILLDVPVNDIAKTASDTNIAEAIRRMRAGELSISPGYDGIFGRVSIFGDAGPPKPTQSHLI